SKLSPAGEPEAPAEGQQPDPGEQQRRRGGHRRRGDSDLVLVGVGDEGRELGTREVVVGIRGAQTRQQVLRLGVVGLDAARRQTAVRRPVVHQVPQGNLEGGRVVGGGQAVQVVPVEQFGDRRRLVGAADGRRQRQIALNGELVGGARLDEL